MSMTDERREELKAEIEAYMGRYNEAFVSGTRDDLQTLVHLPVIYVSGTRTTQRTLLTTVCRLIDWSTC